MAQVSLLLGANGLGSTPEHNPHDDHPDEKARAADELDDLKHVAER